jgi:hypothetical protein
MNCQYCNQPVTDDNTGALCAFHLDLEVLAEALQDQGRPEMVTGLIALINLGLSRGGSLVIVPSDLPWLITPELAQKYEMEPEGVEV